MTDGGIPVLVMRGGTSKGALFLASDLPGDTAARDDLLLKIMGSPDSRQIDGIGGAHPLTSKVAVISPSADGDTDVEYLFLQVVVDQAVVSDQQNCGNILAAVGPFAVERGLVPAGDERTTVRIRMVNTDSIAVATFATPGGRVKYDGDLAIDGVPGTASPIEIEFEGVAGSSTGGRLFPTGNPSDEIDGVRVTLVDNGMPSVLLAASDLGVRGDESPAELEADERLGARIQELRLAAGELMGLGDVRDATVPKMVLLSPPADGGTISTRSFIPIRVHTSIGVLGALTVAAGIREEGAVGHDLARLPDGDAAMRIEHPTGYFDVTATSVLRTARKLLDGVVFPREY